MIRQGRGGQEPIARLIQLYSILTSFFNTNGRTPINLLFVVIFLDILMTLIHLLLFFSLSFY